MPLGSGRFNHKIPEWRWIPWIDRLVGSGDLHSAGQFISSNPGGDFGVVNFLETALVDSMEGGETFCAGRWKSLWAVQIQNWFPFGAKKYAGIGGGEEPALPEGSASA